METETGVHRTGPSPRSPGARPDTGSDRRAREWLGVPIELPGAARVLFTTRAEGNLSSRVGDGAADARVAREALRARLGLTELRSTRQVHGSTVQVVGAAGPHGSEVDASRSQAPVIEADGQASVRTGVGLMALTADCLPVALATPGAVAIVHAGWRGLAGGVLEEGLRVLRSLSEAGEANQITAVIGPGAGPCCYEVGPEVHDALGDGGRGRGTVDLKGLATRRLRAGGVEVVRDSGLCTICDPRLFSFRREGTRSGRLGGIVWREQL